MSKYDSSIAVYNSLSGNQDIQERCLELYPSDQDPYTYAFEGHTYSGQYKAMLINAVAGVHIENRIGKELVFYIKESLSELASRHGFVLQEGDLPSYEEETCKILYIYKLRSLKSTAILSKAVQCFDEDFAWSIYSQSVDETSFTINILDICKTF